MEGNGGFKVFVWWLMVLGYQFQACMIMDKQQQEKTMKNRSGLGFALIQSLVSKILFDF